MKTCHLQFALLLFLCLAGVSGGGSVLDDYKGKPFQDATHTSGPQTIPGRLEAALYDMGGEGIAYHDVDEINHGSGVLNYEPGQSASTLTLPGLSSPGAPPGVRP